MKTILGFDTSGEVLSICLKHGSRYYEINTIDGYKHAQTLMPLIDRIIQKMNLQVEDIELIACSKGPGSFTGLRIGVSTAKGLAYGLGIPYVLVPSLDAIAVRHSFFNGVVLPVIDARKGRFYAAFYKNGQRITDYMDIEPEKLRAKSSQFSQVLLTGSGAPQFLSGNRDDTFLQDSFYDSGISRNIICLGEKQFNDRGPSGISEGPLYLRKSEAELNRMENPADGE